MGNFIDEVRANPLILGGLGVVLLFIILLIHHKVSSTTTPSVAALNASIPDPSTQAVPIVYNNTYNSYPVVGTTPAPPVVTPPVDNKPPDKDKPPVTKPPIVKPPVVTPPKPPVVIQPQYATVTHWPAPGSSLSSIGAMHGVSLDRIKALNPQYSSNWNLVYAGNRVRYS